MSSRLSFRFGGLAKIVPGRSCGDRKGSHVLVRHTLPMRPDRSPDHRVWCSPAADVCLLQQEVYNVGLSTFGYPQNLGGLVRHAARLADHPVDRKSTRLNSSHLGMSYAVSCLK